MGVHASKSIIENEIVKGKRVIVELLTSSNNIYETKPLVLPSPIKLDHKIYLPNQKNTHITWYDNGQPKEESRYMDGKVYFKRLWYEDGQVKEESIYNTYGERSGCCKFWTPAGNLTAKMYYNGVEKTEETEKLTYEYYVREGPMVFFSPTSRPDGTYTDFYDTEKLYPRSEWTYKNGRYDGTHREWRRNGQLSCEINYKNGKYHGINRSWHDNGQFRHVCNYLNGRLYGSNKIWHDNGQPYEESNYMNGKLHGISKIYLDDKGYLYEESNYIDNVCTGDKKTVNLFDSVNSLL